MRPALIISKWRSEALLSARCLRTKSGPTDTARTPQRRWICSCDLRHRGDPEMTTYKILYWQEIPTQIKAEDESDDVAVMMDDKFMAQVDILAAKRGLQASDDYLAQWKWSEEEEREGSAREVAEAVKAELEAKGW